MTSSPQWAAAPKVSRLQRLHRRALPGASPAAGPPRLLQLLLPGAPGSVCRAPAPGPPCLHPWPVRAPVTPPPSSLSSAARRFQPSAARRRPETRPPTATPSSPDAVSQTPRPDKRLQALPPERCETLGNDRANVFLCLRQEVGGRGARRSEAGADGQRDGAAEGGVGGQPEPRWQAQQAHLLQTVAGCVH